MGVRGCAWFESKVPSSVNHEGGIVKSTCAPGGDARAQWGEEGGMGTGTGEDVGYTYHAAGSSYSAMDHQHYEVPAARFGHGPCHPAAACCSCPWEAPRSGSGFVGLGVRVGVR